MNIKRLSPCKSGVEALAGMIDSKSVIKLAREAFARARACVRVLVRSLRGGEFGLRRRVRRGLRLRARHLPAPELERP